MNTKFCVRQMVRSKKFGKGVVVDITADADDTYPVKCEFAGGVFSFTLDGKFTIDKPIDLFYIDPPRVVLTEWQKKQLREYVREEFKYTALFNFFDRLESILSEPEPPKYQPKQGEAVLVRESRIKPWLPAVALGEEYIVYTPTADTIGWSYCRPFDASLVGKVTQD